MRAYRDAFNTAHALALSNCLTNEHNQNLTAAQKLLLRWHFQLGHAGFKLVQWLGRQGYFGMKGQFMGKARCDALQCGTCNLGKQHKTPNPAKAVKDKKLGELKKNVLQPGQVIFSNQYQTNVPSKPMKNKDGTGTTQLYKGGTIFCDAASGYVHVEHQVGLTSYEMIASKLSFERICMEAGITVTSYHTDNGIFHSTEFLKELHEKGQGIKMSGVSAQFQNGAAENTIKNTVAKACTMMFHSALRWPDPADQNLWPYALSHAAYLHNHTPNLDTGLAPVEVFTKTKSNHKVLHNLHVWGCPAYVLDLMLCDGSKLPKWEP